MILLVHKYALSLHFIHLVIILHCYINWKKNGECMCEIHIVKFNVPNECSDVDINPLISRLKITDSNGILASFEFKLFCFILFLFCRFCSFKNENLWDFHNDSSIQNRFDANIKSMSTWQMLEYTTLEWSGLESKCYFKLFKNRKVLWW